MKDILERLRGYNPPDRTTDDQRQIAVDIHEAAAEIEKLRGGLMRLREGMTAARNTNIVDYIDALLSSNARLDRPAASAGTVGGVIGTESPHPMLCFQHGGSEACEAENSKHGFTCPKCSNKEVSIER